MTNQNKKTNGRLLKISIEESCGYWEKEGIIKGRKQREEEILTKAKEFSGSIKTIDELFEHLKRLTECSYCNKVFWDKICPSCVGKQKDVIRKEELEFLKKIQKILNKYHSDIPLIEVGRQNVLSDIDNEIKLDERIKQLGSKDG